MYKKILVLFCVLIIFFLVGCAVNLGYNMVKEDKISNVKTNEEIINKEQENVIENILETKVESKEAILGTLIIEKIGLEAKVKEGSTQEILKNYIGHIEETALYDGNIGLAAHNRGNEYSYFARLNELEIGDTIKYETPYGIKEYAVETISEILETDWRLLANTDKNKITLITCISNKINLRLCVQAVERI